MVDTIGAVAETAGKLVDAGERIADRLATERAELGTASDNLRAPLPEPAAADTRVVDLIREADALLLKLGLDEEGTVLAKRISGLLDEAISIARGPVQS